MPVANRRVLPTWEGHVAKWRDCQLCPLGQQRDRIVLARGTLPCDILLIGEAPGTSEDSLGIPFVEGAPAGRRLKEIIDRSVPPDMTYALTNLVCCYPREAKMYGDNHQPSNDEVKACQPRLYEFINLARPRLIVCVGALATVWVDHDAGVPCADIVHPASILRMPLVQQQMATQKCIVVIRRAIDSVVGSERRNFTDWRLDDAGSNSASWRTTYSDADIPF
jgi:uracil-DNA glycosylase family 4